LYLSLPAILLKLGDLFLIVSASFTVAFHKLPSGFNKLFELVDDCRLVRESITRFFVVDDGVSSKTIFVVLLRFKAVQKKTM
jgi:hypothetical protein